MLRTIINEIVDAPDAVTINFVKGNYTLLIEIKSSTDDKKYLIGREGRTAQSLRILVKAACMRHKMTAVDLNVEGL
jgi:predicted RNA-binding protein YlqC (UPF0109 family)